MLCPPNTAQGDHVPPGVSCQAWNTSPFGASVKASKRPSAFSPTVGAHSVCPPKDDQTSGQEPAVVSSSFWYTTLSRPVIKTTKRPSTFCATSGGPSVCPPRGVQPIHPPSLVWVLV